MAGNSALEISWFCLVLLEESIIAALVLYSRSRKNTIESDKCSWPQEDSCLNRSMIDIFWLLQIRILFESCSFGLACAKFPSRPGHLKLDPARHARRMYCLSKKLEPYFHQLHRVTECLGFGSAFYLGIKCLHYHFSSEAIEGVFMVLLSVSSYFSVLVTAACVGKRRKHAGVKAQDLHEHTVQYKEVTKTKDTCEICGCFVPSGEGVFYCDTCKFICCANCCLERSKSSSTSLGPDWLSKLNEFMKLSQDATKTLRPTLWLAPFVLLSGSVLSLCIPRASQAMLKAAWDRQHSAFNSWVLIFTFLEVFSSLTEAVSHRIKSYCRSQISGELRRRMFVSTLHRDMFFFDTSEYPYLHDLIMNDTQSFSIIWDFFILGTIENIATCLGAVFLSWNVSWKFTFFCLNSLLPITMLVGRNKMVEILQMEARLRSFEASRAIRMPLFQARLVKANSTEEFHLAVVKESLKVHVGAENAVHQARCSSELISILANSATRILFWYVGINLTHVSEDPSANKLSVSDLIALEMYWKILSSSVQKLDKSLTHLATELPRVKRVIVNIKEANKETGRNLTECRGHLELENVVFAFPHRPKRIILRDISLTIPPATSCAIVGKSGTGKTTFLELLLRLYRTDDKRSPNTAGKIMLDGTDINSIHSKCLHKFVGTVPQSFVVFRGSLLENITYGVEPGSWDMDEVAMACKRANLTPVIKDLAEGYETLLGQQGGRRLSGGQRQRLCIARIFLKKPRIMLFDEATSALDCASANLVHDSIHHFVNSLGHTAIMVSHRLSTLQKSSTIVVLDKGTIVEKGTHRELLASGGLYAQLYEELSNKRKE